MSAYLGWSEDKPDKAYVRMQRKYDTDSAVGGPVTNGYEDYIKSVFKSDKNNDRSLMSEEQKNPQGVTASSKGISASAMLKMQDHYGKDCLDDGNDLNLDLDEDVESLDKILADMGVSTGKQYKFQKYPVYKPKSSSEYFSTLNQRKYTPVNNSTANCDAYTTFKTVEPKQWKETDRQMIVDYKQFQHSPLSPYMYKNYDYLKNQDSRIVCSNFVQVTTRPRDRFLEKIDKTLAEVRAMPRY
uniref:Protein TSSC4 n=1 Tax=Rhabditophanes sp. KR3021 TaxID=114890 RepID=A0AC35TSL8_9BILA